MAEISGMAREEGLVGPVEGLAAGVGGAVAGEDLATTSLVSISRMFFDPPASLEDRFKLAPAFLSTVGALVRGMTMDFFFSTSKVAVDRLETLLSDFFFFLASVAALEVELFRFRATGAG